MSSFENTFENINNISIFDDMSSISTSNSTLFVPYDKPISTWKTVSTSLNPAERDYVKFYLGQALIEQCEEIEGEIENLLEIWRDYRNETVAHCTDPKAPILPEPPVLRERLTTEIEFFVKHIHEQCANNDQIFRRRLSSGHNWNAINYAMVSGTGDEEHRIRDRPVSARDRQGRETPILIIPEPATNIDDTKPIHLLSPRSTPNIDVETIRSKLEDFTIDDAIQRLRQAIIDDIKILEQHVTYVHQKLEEEADYRAKTRGLLREPTLGELKEERNRLEKEVFNTSNTRDSTEGIHSLQKQTSIPETTSRRSSVSSTTSSIHSPRSTNDISATKPVRINEPLRAYGTDTTSGSKPRLSIDRKTPILPNTMSKTNAPVLVRLGSIKQEELLKKYSSLQTSTKTTTPKTTIPSDTNTTRPGSAEKFRRMVLDCREMSS